MYYISIKVEEALNYYQWKLVTFIKSIIFFETPPIAPGSIG